jgi:sodium/hydrogen antiporter
MLIATMLMVGLVLVGMALFEAPVRRLPLSTALVYLVVGWSAARLAPQWIQVDLQTHGEVLLVATEWAVLISLFSIGLKLGRPSALRGWQVAVRLAGVGMLVTVVLATVVAYGLLDLPWGVALLLAAMLAPTDPVLASDVQIRSEGDRDAVRLALSAEGALNDGTAFPLVMLGLAAIGLNEFGRVGELWLWHDLVWPVGAGLAIGWGWGRLLGWAVQRRDQPGRPLQGDELLYLGCIASTYALSSVLHASAFLAVFMAGVALFDRGRRPVSPELVEASDLPRRTMNFGERCERLVEVLMVLVVGAGLASVTPSWRMVLFALALTLVVRPLTVWLTLWPHRLPPAQHRMVAWFGIRGVGSLFYLVFALQHGLSGEMADDVTAACLISIALSILLHGVSATPLMNHYHGQRQRRRQGATPPSDGA